MCSCQEKCRCEKREKSCDKKDHRREKAPRALNILLINDDSITDSVLLLRDKLIAAGHAVYTFLPFSNASANGASLIPGPGGRDVIQVDTNFYVVRNPNWANVMNGALQTASVLECLTIGKAFIRQELGVERLDLVISGPNEGRNVGPLSIASGTVMAGLYGTVLCNVDFPDTPALLCSINYYVEPERLEFATSYIVNLVRKLDIHRDDEDRLLPHTTGLQVEIPGINYNTLQDIPIIGVSMNRQGRTTIDNDGTEELSTAFSFQSSFFGREQWAITFDYPVATNVDYPFSNVIALNKGYISLTPVQADITANTPVIKELCKNLTDVLTQNPPDESFCQFLSTFQKGVEIPNRNRRHYPIRNVNVAPNVTSALRAQAVSALPNNLKSGLAHIRTSVKRVLGDKYDEAKFDEHLVVPSTRVVLEVPNLENPQSYDFIGTGIKALLKQ